MIIVNECRIVGGKLILEATVDNLSYFEEVEIDSIIIDTDETFSETGPSSDAIYTQEFETYYASTNDSSSDSSSEDTEDEEDTDGTVPRNKHIRVILSASDLGLDNLDENLFFIYIVAVGYPEITVPCGMDNQYTIAVTCNLHSIYNNAMNAVKEVDNACSIPKNFIDYFLRVKVFELALKTGHFTEALRHWKKLLKNSSSSTSNCGCNES